jgi:hypothetical protein
MAESTLLATDDATLREDSGRPGNCATAGCTICWRPLGGVCPVSQRYRLEVQA